METAFRLDAGWVQILGWTLIHFLWQGTAIAGLGAMGAWLLRRQDSSFRYRYWLGVFLLLVLAPPATCLFLTATSSEQPPAAAVALPTPPPLPEEFVPRDLSVMPYDLRDMPRGIFSTEQQIDFPATDATFEPTPIAVETPATTVVAPPALSWTQQLTPVLPWLVGCWMAGVVLLSLRLIGAWWRLRRLVTSKVQPFSDRWDELASHLMNVLDVRRRVQFLESGLACVPVVIGWLKPVVLVPSAILSNLTPQEVEALLAHELAHIRRWDDVINLLQTVVETLLFYHPAVWWVSSRIRAEREHCCDDLAVRVTRDRLTYSRALISAASLALASNNPLAVASTDGQLTQRVRRLLGMESLGQPRAIWPFVMVLLVLALGVVGLAARSTESETTSDRPQPTGESTEQSPASADESDSPDSVKRFPFGSQVEILAIGTHQEEPQRWWNAQGQTLVSVPFEWSTSSHRSSSSKDKSPLRTIVYRIADLSPDANVQWSINSQYSQAAAQVAAKGKGDSQRYFSRWFATAPTQRNADLRVGVAAGPWKTEHFGNGLGISSQSPAGSFVLSEAIPSESGTAFFVSHTFLNSACRIVVVDKQGHRHSQSLEVESGNIGLIQRRMTFPGLNLADIDHFEFQTRDYEWIEFRDLPLEPVTSVAAVEAVNDGTGSDSATSMTDEQATALARRAHTLASAIDQLPRFSIRAQAVTFSDFKLKEVTPDPLRNFLQALDEPTDPESGFHYEGVFAWDENHFLNGLSAGQAFASDQSQSKRPEGNPPSRNFRWGRRDRSGAFDQLGDQPAQIVFRKDAAEMWQDNTLTSPNYLRATRHQFWWGDNGNLNQYLHGSGIPPELADYRSLGHELFDGELCHVVESQHRMERLWISPQLGVIRGYAALRTDHPEDYYRSEKVREITGRSFATAREYTAWYQSEHAQLPREKQWALAKIWTESLSPEMLRVGQLVRFRDFREIAPGIWWPFREDLAAGGHWKNAFRCILASFQVDEIRTDRDLTDTIASLQPKPGDRVNDQRHGFQFLWYDYRPDLTEEDIQKLLNEQREEMQKGQDTLDKLKEPLNKLVGQPAPTLPDDGWIGGKRPDLTGKPYLVHFWAAWCGPCKNDYPILKQFAENGLTLVGLHPAGTSLADAQKALEESGLPYATCLDTAPAPPGAIQSVAGYPVAMFPYYVLVDSQGNIAAHGSLFDKEADLVGKYLELRDAAQPTVEEDIVDGRVMGVRNPSTSSPIASKEHGDQSLERTITGKVMDEAGKPVAGAEVFIPTGWGIPEVRYSSVFTNRDGNFHVTVNADWLRRPASWRPGTAWVFHPDFALATTSIYSQLHDQPDAAPARVVMRAPMSQRYCISHDDAPVAGAKVTPYRVLTPSRGFEQIPPLLRGKLKRSTDEAGEVTLTALDLERLKSVEVTAAGCGTQEFRSPKERKHEGVQLNLRAAGKIQGKVIATNPDWLSGVSFVINTIEMKAWTGDAKPPEGVAVISQLEPDGSFEVPEIAAGAVRIIPVSNPILPVRLSPPTLRRELAPGETLQLEFPFVPGTPVRGLVKADGQPVPGALVVVGYGNNQQTDHVRTDATGAFAGTVLPGKCRTYVVSMPENFKQYAQRRDLKEEFVTVPPQSDHFDLPPIETVLQKSIQGRLVDQNQNSLPDYLVLGMGKSKFTGGGATNAAGEFTIHYHDDDPITEFLLERIQDHPRIKPGKARILSWEPELLVQPLGVEEAATETLQDSSPQSGQQRPKSYSHKVPHKVGESHFRNGGEVVISEVWGTKPAIEVGGEYVVRGRYVFPPGKNGKLYLFRTATEGDGREETLPRQMATVDQQSGEFELIHRMNGPGKLHVTLRDAANYDTMFADVYFDTDDNVSEAKRESSPVEPEDKAPATDAVSAMGRIDGRVSWKNDEPVAGHRIIAVRRPDDHLKDSEGEPVEAVTDADGRYAISNLPAGSYLIRQVPSPRTLKWTDHQNTVPVKAGEIKTVNFALHEGRHVTGIVTVAPDGEPAGNIELICNSNAGTLSTRTDENGRYEFFVPLWDIEIRAVPPPGHSAHPGSAHRERLEVNKEGDVIVNLTIGPHREVPLHRQFPVDDPRHFAQIELHLARREYFLGENILLHYSVTNVGDQPIPLDFGGDGRNSANRQLRFKVVATDEHGNVVPDPFQSIRDYGGWGDLMGGLQQGETYWDPLALMRFCKFGKPGTYRVQVYHDLGWDREPGNFFDRVNTFDRVRNGLPTEDHLAPILETTLVLKMPDEQRAREVLARTLHLPTDPDRTIGQFCRDYSDFTTLRFPVYLPLVYEWTKSGSK